MDGRSLSDLMSYENPPNLSETITKWGALAKAHVPQRVGGEEFPYMHNIFLYMRKNISAYTKINRRIYASLSAHIRGTQRLAFARRLARGVRGEGALPLR